jgi:hypothetical protein
MKTDGRDRCGRWDANLQRPHRKTELRPAHWRGSRELGEVRKSYRLRDTEEKTA